MSHATQAIGKVGEGELASSLKKDALWLAATRPCTLASNCLAGLSSSFNCGSWGLLQLQISQILILQSVLWLTSIEHAPSCKSPMTVIKNALWLNPWSLCSSTWWIIVGKEGMSLPHLRMNSVFLKISWSLPYAVGREFGAKVTDETNYYCYTFNRYAKLIHSQPSDSATAVDFLVRVFRDFHFPSSLDSFSRSAFAQILAGPTPNSKGLFPRMKTQAHFELIQSTHIKALVQTWGNSKHTYKVSHPCLSKKACPLCLGRQSEKLQVLFLNRICTQLIQGG